MRITMHKAMLRKNHYDNNDPTFQKKKQKTQQNDVIMEKKWRDSIN